MIHNSFLILYFNRLFYHYLWKKTVKIGVPVEQFTGENRVALVPDVVKKLVKDGFSVLIEKGAGDRAFYSDSDYAAAGAKIAPTAEELYSSSNIIFKVRHPLTQAEGKDEVSLLKKDTLLVSFLQPMQNTALMQELAARGINAISMDFIPRTTKAQRMDALSSQNNLAGYKAALTAANHYGRIFPMLMTAAATITAAKVLVIGAGVAGLQALGTARRLGAVVEVTDVRTAVKEEVHSLGGKFIDILPGANLQDERGYAREATPEELQMQKEALLRHVKGNDIIITTAVVPGRKAPEIITEEMVKEMKNGSVIVDLAADFGGNCTLTKPSQTITAHGVTIIGESNFPSQMAPQASDLYAKNIYALIEYMKGKQETLTVNTEDEIVKESLITWQGSVFNSRVLSLISKNG